MVVKKSARNIDATYKLGEIREVSQKVAVEVVKQALKEDLVAEALHSSLHRHIAPLANKLFEKIAGIPGTGELGDMGTGIGRADVNTRVSEQLADNVEVGMGEARLGELRFQIISQGDIEESVGERMPLFLGDISDHTALVLFIFRTDSALDHERANGGHQNFQLSFQDFSHFRIAEGDNSAFHILVENPPPGGHF